MKGPCACPTLEGIRGGGGGISSEASGASTVTKSLFAAVGDMAGRLGGGMGERAVGTGGRNEGV